MSARRRNLASEKEQVQSNGGRTGADLEADPAAVPGGSLQSEPVREMESKGAAAAWDSSFQELKRRLLDAYHQSESPIRLEMRFSDLRQRKDQPVRDFASEVAEVGCKADKSESELISSFILGLASKEIHRELCLREQATLTKARHLAERVTEIEEGQRRTVDDAASGNVGLAKTESFGPAHGQVGGDAGAVVPLCNPYGEQWSALSAVAWATSDATAPTKDAEPNDSQRARRATDLGNAGF
ncbi:hypothetical protein T07_4195 [Trichinella nelsoni]|uniref:Retrotransposon gag domain-containing protein n=1 Tax=Trichinella nelsoni TaxID=6336 RepID=A0A0V0RHK3_9BILA|nr:hypothetical protein T07_4195 [Trichinella nelsoni]